ncbi:hypothetical protein F3157_07085 [Virgibacillus dakarensis]|uniref:Phosphatidylinositol kinase n=1 Tax=Lentibacillus populi TaxID=1827502 RepID=A0A9W5TXC2_9BACI|nr:MULTISPECIES: hypothetical protein [Bacillaceae]MBT2215406.1 hypothetical protein [Virgibacillus dakarensis]MTW85425.1 hypothetical protein [Virgibacillus dakarensis]GGB39934.1 hypothetical protein GCM10011409_16830 [Lentibacillus populi]
MKQDYHHIYELCKDHMHSYVLAELVDGSKVDGIVTGLDDEYVYLAIPLEQYEHHTQPEMNHQNRQFGYGYPGYGYPGGFGYPGYGYPPRRFRRLILPLAALTALSVLPWY